MYRLGESIWLAALAQTGDFHDENPFYLCHGRFGWRGAGIAGRHGRSPGPRRKLVGWHWRAWRGGGGQQWLLRPRPGVCGAAPARLLRTPSAPPALRAPPPAFYTPPPPLLSLTAPPPPPVCTTPPSRVFSPPPGPIVAHKTPTAPRAPTRGSC